MVAPSKAFTAILDSQIDGNSPITVQLMTEIRDSLIHLEEWLGKDFVAAVNHDHDGVNSKLTKVETPLVTNVANDDAVVDFTGFIDASFDAYLIECINVRPASDQVLLRIRLALAGVFQVGANDYNDAAGLGSFLRTSGVITAGLKQGNLANELLNGQILLFAPSAAKYTFVLSNLGYLDASGSNVRLDTEFGLLNDTAAVDGIRLYYESGNVAEGTIHLKGLRG